MTKLEEQLRDALRGLHLEVSEYARINNLYGLNNNLSMTRATAALNAYALQCYVENGKPFPPGNNSESEKCSGGLVAVDKDPRLKRTYTMLTGGVDREMDAMDVCLTVLNELDRSAALNVLAYVTSRVDHRRDFARDAETRARWEQQSPGLTT